MGKEGRNKRDKARRDARKKPSELAMMNTNFKLIIKQQNQIMEEVKLLNTRMNATAEVVTDLNDMIVPNIFSLETDTYLALLREKYGNDTKDIDKKDSTVAGLPTDEQAREEGKKENANGSGDPAAKGTAVNTES